MLISFFSFFSDVLFISSFELSGFWIWPKEKVLLNDKFFVFLISGLSKIDKEFCFSSWMFSLDTLFINFNFFFLRREVFWFISSLFIFCFISVLFGSVKLLFFNFKSFSWFESLFKKLFIYLISFFSELLFPTLIIWLLLFETCFPISVLKLI